MSGSDEKCREAGANLPTAGDRTYAWDPDSDDDGTIVAGIAADYVARTFESLARAAATAPSSPTRTAGPSQRVPAGRAKGLRGPCGAGCACPASEYFGPAPPEVPQRKAPKRRSRPAAAAPFRRDAATQAPVPQPLWRRV